MKFSVISWNYWKSGPKITLFYWSLLSNILTTNYWTPLSNKLTIYSQNIIIIQFKHKMPQPLSNYMYIRKSLCQNIIHDTCSIILLKVTYKFSQTSTWWVYLFAQDKLARHFELHKVLPLKHLYLFVWQRLLPEQLHFVNPCPWPLDWDVKAASLREMLVDVLTSSGPKSFFYSFQ